MLKRLGIEALLFIPALGLGMYVFMTLASYSNEVKDAYWTAQGFPPPRDYAFDPGRIRWLILLGPWALFVVVRIVRFALQRRGSNRHLSAA